MKGRLGETTEMQNWLCNGRSTLVSYFKSHQLKISTLTGRQILCQLRQPSLTPLVGNL